MIEVSDEAVRALELPKLSACAHWVELSIGDWNSHARVNLDVAGAHFDRPSAVHFLRFELAAAAKRQLRDGAPAQIWKQ